MERENITFNDFACPVNIAHRNTDDNKSLRAYHFHNAVELVYVSEGSILCEVGEESVVLCREDMIFINSNTIHRLSFVSKNAKFTYIQFDADEYLNRMFPDNYSYLYEFMNASQAVRFAVFPFDGELSEILKGIERVQMQKPDYHELSLKGYMYLLVAFMCRKKIFYDFQRYNDFKLVSRIMPAVDYVEKNFKEKISLESVCAELYINKYNFCKLFKRVTGGTFVEYVNFRRIAHAQELLAKTDSTVVAVALESGFTSIQYFNRVFKQTKRCTPNNYRRMRG